MTRPGEKNKIGFKELKALGVRKESDRISYMDERGVRSLLRDNKRLEERLRAVQEEPEPEEVSPTSSPIDPESEARIQEVEPSPYEPEWITDDSDFEIEVQEDNGVIYIDSDSDSDGDNDTQEEALDRNVVCPVVKEEDLRIFYKFKYIHEGQQAPPNPRRFFSSIPWLCNFQESSQSRLVFRCIETCCDAGCNHLIIFKDEGVFLHGKHSYKTIEDRARINSYARLFKRELGRLDRDGIVSDLMISWANQGSLRGRQS